MKTANNVDNCIKKYKIKRRENIKIFQFYRFMVHISFLMEGCKFSKYPGYNNY